MRCFKIERFSRTMAELMHDSLNLVIGYILKAAPFGKVLSYQTIGICNGQVKPDTFLSSLLIEFPLKFQRGSVA